MDEVTWSKVGCDSCRRVDFLDARAVNVLGLEDLN